MIFANVKGITIPEGVVKRITQGSAVLWQAAYDAIVSGVSPLTLPSAVQEAIVYLKQLGVCGQNGTPTPSVPVDIYCNNGALKAVDDELPVGYRRIASITFGGNTYYDTGEKLYGSDIVTITIADFVSSGQNLFGCYSGTGSDDINFSMYIYGTTTGQAYWRYGQTLYRPVLGGTAERTISFGAGGTTGFKTDATYSAVEFETTSNARIGALPNSSSSKYDGTIKGNITVGTRLKYIPCIRISDGAIGYYETVKGVFLEPQGTAPVAGAYDYSHLVVKVVGTPEVLNVTHNLVEEPSVVPNAYVRGGNASDTKPLGDENYGSGWYCSGYIPVEPETAYKTIVAEWNSATGAGLCFYASQSVESCISGVTAQQQGGAEYEFTTPEGCHYVRFSWKTGGRTGGAMYKLSEIHSASVQDLLAVGDYKDEQDIISGNVTHRVGIKVFDGTELYSSMSYGYATEELSGFANESFAPLCTHFMGKTTASAATDTIRLYFTSGGVPRTYFFVDKAVDDFSTVDKFTAWLASQYAAGTPVIVVYPLATATTESVTAQPLNTAEGDNTISVTAEVSNIPLEVKYKRN